MAKDPVHIGPQGDNCKLQSMLMYYRPDWQSSQFKYKVYNRSVITIKFSYFCTINSYDIDCTCWDRTVESHSIHTVK